MKKDWETVTNQRLINAIQYPGLNHVTENINREISKLQNKSEV